MKVGIVGLGLIGGSMAIDLKRRHFADEIIGVEADKVNGEAAMKIGLADRLESFENCVAEADITILAVPVGVAVKLLPKALDACQGSNRFVVDVCSVKGQMARAANCHSARRHYVAMHPMAGTEYSGPWAAMSGLFDGRACIICDSEESDPKFLHVAEKISETLNMRTIYMGSAAHDVHTAYVSHISHVTSFALALTVLDKEKDDKHIFDLASGGFSSTVRLAKSNADMWVPILAQNHDNVLRVIDTYIEKMKDFRNAIESYDESKIRELIDEANKIKRIIR